MRLSKVNERRLTQVIWRERARRAAIVAVIAALVGGAAVYMTNQRALRADPTLDVKTVEATVVEGFKRGIRKGYIFHAKLAGGEEIDAFSSTGIAPAPGEHVVLGEARHKSGKLSYDLIRIAQ